MNVAHLFREGNGRSTRIWYLLTIERSPIKDVEIKVLLKNALTDQIDDREVYSKGIDVRFYYPDKDRIEDKETFINFYSKCYFMKNNVFVEVEKEIENLLKMGKGVKRR